MKTAFLTGCTGQDGALLAAKLLYRDYKVVGMIRRTSAPTDWRLKELGVLGHPNFLPCSGDLTDQASIERLLKEHRPDEVYNLGAQSFVGDSWKIPVSTIDITGLGAIRLFDAVRNVIPTARVYQASSSEMFGGACRTEALDERSSFEPRSPYAVAKVLAHYGAATYRASYGQHVSCGILFNHESEYRGQEFVTRKVTHAAAAISLGLQKLLVLENLDSVRDWGYAADFVEAMWLMLQKKEPGDYVIATGVIHSVRELCALAFSAVGIEDFERYIGLSSSKRPADVKYLRGNATRARVVLGWSPTIDFEEMIRRMVEKDIERLKHVNLGA